MSNKKNRKSTDTTDLFFRSDRILAGLFVILTGLVTFLIRIHMVKYTSPKIVNPLLDTGWQADIYSYHKLIFVVMAALIAILILSYKILVEKYTIKASYLNVPLLLLVLAVVLSTLTADYKSISLLGLYNQGTGALIMLAYLALCWAAANTVFRPWFNQAITAALLGITIANAIIVLSYFFSIHLNIKNLLAPREMQQYLSGGVLSTLGNPNYISGLAAALCTFFMTMMLLKKSWRQRLMYILAALLSFAMILASLSSSGFVTLLIVLPLIIAAAFLSQDRRQTALAGGITLLLCLGIFTAMNSYDPQVGKETLGFIKSGIKLNQITPAPGAVLAEIIPIMPLTAVAAEHPNPPADSFELPKSGWGAGSGRVYTWGKTLELIQARPWVGYGQGTLAYYFPQDDIHKVSALYSYDTLITKPHNMYLGIAFGSGIPALLFMLALFCLHFYHTGRRLWQAESGDTRILAAAIFLFCCAFAIQGLFNDIVIDAGAIFWVLLGVGISLNRKLVQ